MDSRDVRRTAELLHEADVRRPRGVPPRSSNARARRANQDGPMEMARRAGVYGPRTSRVDSRRLSRTAAASRASEVALHRLDARVLHVDDGGSGGADRAERPALWNFSASAEIQTLA